MLQTMPALSLYLLALQLTIMRFLLYFFSCLFIYQNCFSQVAVDSTVNRLADSVVKNIDRSDKEKILLVTERKIYTTGEKVYFKAYLVDSINNYLQNKTKKLFVDLIDDKDSVFQQLILDASNFKTSGSFSLPDVINQGYYWLRAYTMQMATNDVNSISVTPIFVISSSGLKNIKDTAGISISPANNYTPVIKLFPEGGAIISGLNSTVAIKATDQNNMPLKISGIIKDNRDSIIAQFTTNQDGLAKFTYYPVWFHKYKVLVQHNNAYDSIAAIPPINFFAAQLAVIQQNQNYITVRVALEDSVYSKNFTTYLIAVSGDSACFASVGRGMYNANISLAKFPPGIATLYLFDNKNVLLSSRSIYIKKDDYHIMVNADKQNYSAREKIKLNFEVTDANNNSEVAALSLSVADKDIADTDFNVMQSDTLQQLSQADADLIMLTQKEKNNPLALIATNFNNTDEDTGFLIRGTIVNTKDKPVAKCIVTILSNQANPIVETDTSDVNGRFNFNLPDYYDTLRFTYQLSSIKGTSLNTYRAILDRDSLMHFTTPSYLKTTFPLIASFQSIKSELIHSDSVFSFSGKHWLKPVIVRGYKKPEVNYDESKRVSRNSQIFTSDMLREGAGMTKIILLNNPSVRRLFFGPPSIAGDPLVVLDGNEIPKSEIINIAAATGENPILQFIDNIPVSTIDFIEVLAGPEAAAYGMEGGHGVILINTRAGGGNITPAVALKNFYATGFYNDKPFEIPDYANKQMLKSKLPDLRKTIYWNGNIITDKDGKASVEFFAADPATTYVGVITGITVNGDKIYKTFTLSRK